MSPTTLPLLPILLLTLFFSPLTASLLLFYYFRNFRPQYRQREQQVEMEMWVRDGVAGKKQKEVIKGKGKGKEVKKEAMKGREKEERKSRFKEEFGDDVPPFRFEMLEGWEGGWVVVWDGFGEGEAVGRVDSVVAEEGDAETVGAAEVE